jgi:hypothetical protein
MMGMVVHYTHLALSNHSLHAYVAPRWQKA